MRRSRSCVPIAALATGLSLLAVSAIAQTTLGTGNNAAPPATPGSRPPTRADILRGEYGRYRANNDLRYYNLDVRIDPAKKLISGKNSIRFRMLKDDTRIQIDLYANLAIEKIVMNLTPLKFTRELNAVFVDFPETLRAGPRLHDRLRTTPARRAETGPLWRFLVRHGPDRQAVDHHRMRGAGREHLVAEQGSVARRARRHGAERRDPERSRRRVERPVHGQDRSRRRLHALGLAHPLPDQLLQRLGQHRELRALLRQAMRRRCTLDFYALPGSLDKAKEQFAQARPMIEAYQKVFGEYPFAKDGYKLIEVPYSGMEHQSAVTYGNRFANGYLERDWTGVGVSLKFDFIIIHESAHEWFGNAVSAADVSDMWIQEGWTTYLEGVYVEQLFGYDDALKYMNGYKTKVANREPIITQRGIHRSPGQDQYFKGALFLHTLSAGIVGRTERRERVVEPLVTVRDVYQQFKYKNIMTEELVAFVNKQVGNDLTPIFDQYLRRANLPTLRAGVQRRGEDGGVSLGGRRARVRDADQGRRAATTGRSSRRRPTGS